MMMYLTVLDTDRWLTDWWGMDKGLEVESVTIILRVLQIFLQTALDSLNFVTMPFKLENRVEQPVF